MKPRPRPSSTVPAAVQEGGLGSITSGPRSPGPGLLGRLLWIGLALSAFGAPAILAQGSSPEPVGDDSAFGEVIDVRVVNLEVVVTEGGERVRGLSADDFELRVDGQVVPVEYFSEVEGGISVSRQAGLGGSSSPGQGANAAADGTAADGTAADGTAADGTAADGTVPAVEPGKAVGTSFLLFIDDFFTQDRDRDRVLDGFIEQMPNLQPWDRMAVVAFNGEKLDMLSNWSNDVRDLTRVLQKAKLRPTRGLQRWVRNRAFESQRDLSVLELPYDTSLVDRDDSIWASFLAGYSADLTVEEEQYARQVFQQSSRAVRAATATLRSFANPPGRKVMLLLSGGWPSDPALWATGDTLRSGRGSRVGRGQSLLSPLVETANLLSYTIYPVDVPGMTAAPNDVSDVTVGLASDSLFLAAERERSEEASLYQIARETGGKALVNANRSRAFEAVVADTRSYYWLGFTPSWQGDDSAHNVEVEVRRKGADVRARRGFSDLSRGTEVTMMVESSLLIGDPPSAAPLAARVKPGKRSGLGKRVVPLEVAIPLGQLTFLPTAQGFQAEAELRVAVLDGDGATTDIPVVPLQLSAESQPKPNDFKLFSTDLKLRNQRHDLVVSLYDRASGKILSAKLEVPARR